ncbi:MAG: c-type cytochrome biogenesis protein CcsB [Syntrophobacterales bacterium]|jgi:cytochrome c-type biogenesis protein CcsB|nr:c-type cytochrome biogenesis protein CcsB [Syntrophobacterales bacterium]
MNNVFLYLALAAYFGATGLWLAYFLAQRERYYRYGAWVMTGGLAAQTAALIQRAWIDGYLPAATFGEALLLLAWALVAAFLVLNWRYPIKVLGALVAPLAALMVSGTLILPQRHGALSPALQGFWLAVHICLTLLGVAALALAGLGGILYLIQERQIKGKRFGFFYRRLPSLSQLDTLNYWCLTIGFPLLTAGMISGSLYAQHTMGRFFSWDPKEVLTLIAWLLYAVLLHERLTVGWRGRRAALLAICGLLVLILTFAGANLWFSGYHSFSHFIQQP